MATEQHNHEEPELFSIRFRSIANYKADEVIFLEGSRGRDMFVIYSGRVKISRKDADEHETVLSILEPGEIFGEMALIDHEPRSATATSIDNDTQLVVLDRARFKYLIRYEPEFALILMKTLCQRVREKDAQYTHLAEGTKSGRAVKKDGG